MKKFFVVMMMVAVMFSVSGLSFADNVLMVGINSSCKTVRTFHLNKEVTDQSIETFYSKDCLDNSFSCKESKHFELARKIFDIPGVSEVRFSKRYRITVTKGEMYEWEEVQKEVLWAIKTYFKTKKMITKSIED